MDPAAGVDSPSALLNKHIYNGLVKIDENKQVVSDLAESFEMVDDVTYKFRLKEGVLFHNGEELKASDVKFTLERCKTMPRAMSNAAAIDHVSVEGDYECFKRYQYVNPVGKGRDGGRRCLRGSAGWHWPVQV